jgi:hypothetical protein
MLELAAFHGLLGSAPSVHDVNLPRALRVINTRGHVDVRDLADSLSPELTYTYRRMTQYRVEQRWFNDLARILGYPRSGLQLSSFLRGAAASAGGPMHGLLRAVANKRPTYVDHYAVLDILNDAQQYHAELRMMGHHVRYNWLDSYEQVMRLLTSVDINSVMLVHEVKHV